MRQTPPESFAVMSGGRCIPSRGGTFSSEGVRPGSLRDPGTSKAEDPRLRWLTVTSRSFSWARRPPGASMTRSTVDFEPPASGLCGFDIRDWAGGVTLVNDKEQFCRRQDRRQDQKSEGNGNRIANASPSAT